MKGPYDEATLHMGRDPPSYISNLACFGDGVLCKDASNLERQDHPWLQNANKAPNVNLGETVRARLQQFSVMNKFKKKALRVIAEHLSVEEIADIKEMFENMDINKKGQINFDELKYGLRKLGHQVANSDVIALLEAVSYC
ncbi:hypothetical protein ZIOFF_018113 [Zingiber officinale]|uniref:EF-hand domain-containing protein n=1 Tax=Zingiber officinale TaxID=94328 RepID=A0A8J5H6N6_ZINOF|nr:hypothetical protein ZIOFF_018113 [Zingiber officinale]